MKVAIIVIKIKRFNLLIRKVPICLEINCTFKPMISSFIQYMLYIINKKVIYKFNLFPLVWSMPSWDWQ